MFNKISIFGGKMSNKISVFGVKMLNNSSVFGGKMFNKIMCFSVECERAERRNLEERDTRVVPTILPASYKHSHKN